MSPSTDLAPGLRCPDIDLPDHDGRLRRLSELAGGDPLVLCFSRGWWCPKEQRFLRGLVSLQDEFEVAYARLAVITVDPPAVLAAFRAGLGARFAFLSDHDRRWLERLDLLETTDTVHHPYRPVVLSLFPDLTIHSAYQGYWFSGRPTLEELRLDVRQISAAVRADWELA